MATQNQVNINITHSSQNLDVKPVLSININESINKILETKQNQASFNLVEPPIINSQVDHSYNSEFSDINDNLINQILSVEIKQTKNGLAQKYRKMIKNLKMKQSSQLCTICIMGFVKDQIIKQLPCGHILHRDCAKPWLKLDKRCPVCRYDLQKHFFNEQLKIDSQVREQNKKNLCIKCC